MRLTRLQCVIIVSVFATLCFCAVSFFGGYITGSNAATRQITGASLERIQFQRRFRELRSDMEKLDKEIRKAELDADMKIALIRLDELDFLRDEIMRRIEDSKPLTPERQRAINAKLDKLWDDK